MRYNYLLQLIIPLCLFFLLAGLNNKAHAYKKMLGDTTTWKVLYFWSGTFEIICHGDTIINSKNYKILHYDDPDDINPTRLFFLREDSLEKRVWVLPQDSVNEKILYDFSLDIGDSIYLDFHPANEFYFPSGWYYVESITNYNLISSTVNKFTLYQKSNPVYKVYWLEGVGNTYSPIYTLEQKIEPNYPEVLCMFQDSEDIYRHPTWDTCSYFNTSANFDLTKEKMVDIYPNPNSGKFVLKIELQRKTEFQIQLTSNTGQIIYSESVVASFYKKEIDFSGYAKGVYALKVVSDGGVVTKKVIYR